MEKNDFFSLKKKLNNLHKWISYICSVIFVGSFLPLADKIPHYCSVLKMRLVKKIKLVFFKRDKTIL